MARVNEGSQFNLPPTRASGMRHACLYSSAAEHHPLWLVFIFHPAEGMKLSWPGWLVTCRVGFPLGRRSLIPILNT